MTRSALFLLCLTPAALLACGGATETDLGSSPTGPGFDGGAVLDATGGTDATAGDDSGGGNDSGGGVDAGRDADVVRDARPDRDPAPDGGALDDDIQCSPRSDAGVITKTCVPGQQACCITTGGAARIYDCRSLITPVACVGVDLLCDDRADCTEQGRPGDVCCGRITNNQVTRSSCTQASACNANSDVILCDPREANACPNGGSCNVSSINLPGYTICF